VVKGGWVETRSRGGRFARLGFVPGQGFDGTAPWIRKRRMREGRGGGLRREESPEPAGIDRQRRLPQRRLVWVGRDGRGHDSGKENMRDLISLAGEWRWTDELCWDLEKH
jgi:hypothetical protein